jgi:hypothetical protein
MSADGGHAEVFNHREQMKVVFLSTPRQRAPSMRRDFPVPISSTYASFDR